MKKLLLALALTTAFNPAQAATESPEHTISILAGGWSQHWGDPFREGYNEDNEIRGLVFDNKYLILKMHNSYWHESYVAAYNYSVTSYQFNDLSINAGVMVGVATGYTKEEVSVGRISDDLILYLVPNIQFKYQLTERFNVGVDLGFIGHKYGVGTTQTINLTYSF